MFSGFRLIRKKVDGKVESMPQMPKQQLTRNLFKLLEKCSIINYLEHTIVQAQLNKCTEKDSPEYIARVCALIEKSVTIPQEKKNENMG
jgi:hypothetical protein